MTLLKSTSIKSSGAVFFVLIICVFGSAAFGQPWLGSGTAEDPYQIWTAEDMNAIGANQSDWDKHFKLMADIDLSAYTGTSFNTIGNGTTKFRGVFDGNGHTISNFTGIQGLFGVVSLGGTIQDLGLIDPNVNAVATSSTGSLANVLTKMGSTISGCYVEGGSVTGYPGSPGWLSNAGGLVGKNVGATITNCYSTASVSGNESVGGLVGYNYSTGAIISNCYSTGSVSGNRFVGGLVGNSEWGGEVTNCYATGSVSGTTNVGGLVGINWQATVNNSFWDTETSGQTISAGGTGKTTAEMQDMNTFLGAGWDFVGEYGNGPSDDWAMPIGGGYPILWWQVPENELPPLPTFSGGAGTESDPYLISNATDLNRIGHNGRLMGKHFRLVNDIDLTGVDFFFIGTQGYGYSGVFDGNGHTISNFTSTGGLFGAVAGQNAEIRDLGLIDPNVDGGTGSVVGSLVGVLNNDARISGCYVEGASVSGGSSVGGLVGYNYEGAITNCYSSASVSSTGLYAEDAGGLVGVNTGTITNCSSGGSVSGERYVGGLVGRNEGLSAIISSCYSTGTVSGRSEVGGLVRENLGTITNCYAAGSVVGAGYSVGGLVGVLQSGGVSNCYATGSVSGNRYVGGLVGMSKYVTIMNCYSTASVSGNGGVGGLVGENEGGTIRDCSSAGSVSGGGAVGGLVGTGPLVFFSFWDIQTSGQTISAGGIGLPTAQMQMESTFTVVGWDFVYTWDICEGTNYPKLVWQVPVLGDFGCPDGVDWSDLGVLCGEWLFELIPADVAPDGGDGFVNFLDWAIFADGWQTTHDIFDLAEFADQWLKTGSNDLIADIAPAPDGDGVVNFRDFATLANNWLAGDVK